MKGSHERVNEMTTDQYYGFVSLIETDTIRVGWQDIWQARIMCREKRKEWLVFMHQGV